MRTFARYALSISAAAALLAACGGSQPPIGAPGTMPQSRALAHAERGGSWMLPEAKSEDLLYVANLNAGTVAVYGYQRRDLVGTLDVIPTLGDCVDRLGNVYITGGPGIVEFAHGGTEPIKTIADAYGLPYACSVDKNGDVAVANFRDDGFYPGNVTIYSKNAIKMYSTQTITYYSACGYDTDGNLLVGGSLNPSGSGSVSFAMLPRGGNKLVDISLGASSQSWPFVSAIQWDGKYWAVTIPAEGTKNETVYRYSIVSSRAKSEGHTVLYSANGQFGQTWIVNQSRNVHRQGMQIVTTEGAIDEVQYFRYPKGKRARVSFTSSGYPAGVTFSAAQRRHL